MRLITLIRTLPVLFIVPVNHKQECIATLVLYKFEVLVTELYVFHQCAECINPLYVQHLTGGGFSTYSTYCGICNWRTLPIYEVGFRLVTLLSKSKNEVPENAVKACGENGGIVSYL
jgi:hypothetical protein